MKESLELSGTFKVEPSVIYIAWLTSYLHEKMTGGAASCGNTVGDAFSAWDGYITGKNIELVENEKIVQSWRTSEFDKGDEDSILTVSLKKVKGGTKVTLNQTNIPEGQTQYKKGWIDHYFTPMKAFFSQVSL